MSDSTWAEFWWNSITGPKMLVSKVAATLCENNAVILNVPEDLPWRYQMRSAIEISCRKDVSSEDVLVQTIDEADECNDQEPGRFLLEKYCKSREIRMGYRESSTKTIQQYLISNRVLHDTIIWVKGFRPKQSEKWIAFCRDYKSKSITDGLFLLEIKGLCSANDKKSIPVVKFDDWISNYDVQLLNSFILDKAREYSDNWKKYVSTLAAVLCGSDAEISTELLDVMDFTIDEPSMGLRIIDDSGCFSSRGRDGSSKHILSLYRRDMKEELSKRIWTAQVQVLFPLIELERARFVSTYSSEIQKVLDEEEIKQNGEVLTKPIEVEIGSLYYLVKSHRIYMPSVEDRQRIEALRHYRNKIAHMVCLSPQEIADLLSLH